MSYYNLEREGFLKFVYQDFYKVVNDQFPIDGAAGSYESPILMTDNEADFNVLSEDDKERFQERAGILEFCGGFTRNEAERLAYGALFNH